jgi:calcineurin-like phosphoesterase family protein
MKKKYLDHLSELVTWDGVERPRVRHPLKWTTLRNHSKSGNFVDLENTDKNIWIWSDHHFRHERVISMCNRPFKSVEEMMDTFVNNYNEVVKEGDIVIWAGDITFKSTTHANEEILPLFNKTYNIQVVGNHDFNKKKIRTLDFDERHLLIKLKINKKLVVITHYPFGNEDENFINVHGHTHNRNTDKKHQLNVSVENIDYKPVNLKELIKNL